MYKKCVVTSGLIWSACAVVLILTYFFVLIPQAEKKAGMEREYAAKSAKYTGALKAEMPQTKLALEQSLLQVREKMGEFVIKAEEVPELCLNLSKVAVEKQLTLFTSRVSLSKEKTKGWERISENRIDLSFLGEFTAFARFLNALERFTPVVFVDHFTITKGDHLPSNKATLNATVLVTGNPIRQNSNIRSSEE